MKKKLKINLAGKIFGRLTVLSFLGKRFSTIRSDRFWLCKCVCGNQKECKSSALLKGSTKSCGCLAIDAPIKHGLCRSAEYKSWSKMKERCLNRRHVHYCKYGGRGIKICKLWISDFSIFLKDMGKKPTPQHSLDRRDNNGNYTPKNCRWATKKEQSNNRNNNHWRLINGKVKTASQWAEELGCNKSTIARGIGIRVCK